MSGLHNLKLIAVVTILPVVALAVLGTSFLFRDRVSFFSQAAADTIVQINPKTTNIQAKKNIDVTVLLTNKKAIKNSNITITFDKTYLKLVGDPKPNPLLGTIVEITKAADANKTGVIVVRTKIPKADPEFKNGYLFTFTLRGKAATPNATSVTLDVSKSSLKTTAGENILDAGSARNATYVIRPANTSAEPVCDEITVTPSSGTGPLEVTASMVGIPANSNKPIQYVFNFEGKAEAPSDKKTMKHTFTKTGIYEVIGLVKDADKTSEKCTATVEVIDPTDLSHTICVNNACTEVSGPGTDSCTTVGAACGDKNKHNVCQNNACVSVAGAGTDQCAPVGISCAVTSHNVCINDACVSVAGAGANECPTVGVGCGEKGTHSVCQNNACVLVQTIGVDECSPVGGSCGVSTSHNECVNDACVIVAGAGANQCPTVGKGCGTANTYKECRNNACTVVSGVGRDTCTVAGAACGSTPSHKACINNACTVIAGSGSDECATPGTACQQTQTHLVCGSNNTCTVAQGAGANQGGCSTAGQSCGVSTGATHLVCTNNACATAPGSGANENGCTVLGQTCISQTNATHLVCSTNNTCTVAQGAGTNASGCTNAGDTCGVSSPQPVPIPTYLACVNNACAKVQGTGTNLDSCTTEGAACSVASCPDANNPSCQDCNGDRVVNILDFSCFAKAYNQPI